MQDGHAIPGVVYLGRDWLLYADPDLRFNLSQNVAPALVFGATTLTYAQLDARANQLAHALREQGVGPDALVGLCIERSIEMVVGLLGILKAGAAYVPLDPEYPPERLAYMIEDSGIQLLLSQQSLLACTQ